MSSELKMKGPVEAELTVTVPEKDVTAAMNKAYGMLRRTARVRGFRQGKAPRNILQRMYGKAVRSDVQTELVQTHLFFALKEHELEPLSEFDFDEFELKENTNFEFKVSFEVRPRLEQVEYDGIAVDRHRQAVTAEEIDEELQKLRSSLASVSDLSEPRPAQSGDAAMVAVKRWVDGNWEENGMPEQEIVIGNGQAPKEMEDALIGMNVGDEKVVDLGSEEAMEDDRMRYMIRLAALKERKLPELDDELAKDTGDYDTFDELKADVEKRILEAKDRSEDQRLRSSLFGALREKNAMDLPPSLLERQAANIKQNFFGQIAAQLKSDDEKDQETLAKLDESAHKTATDMVHQHLLMMEIARLEKIKVEDKDIEEEIERISSERGIPLPMVRAEIGKEGRREDLANQILESKIFDFVKSRVTINELDRPEEVATDSGSKTETKGGADKKGAKTTGDVKKKAKKKEAAAKKEPAKKSAPKKTAAKKTPAKKASGKKTAAKKAPAKKTTDKKAPANKASAKKKTTAKKAETKKKAAKKTAAKK